MSCVQCCMVLTFIMVMMIGMVKGRWLEVEPSMVSDGIDYDMSHENSSGYIRMGSSVLDGETRCQSIYGFLPCADTMPEGVFLMIMYTYLMMLGEDWIRKGSEALFLLLGDNHKAIGASVFRVLMALPRIVLVVVAGVISTEAAAQSQVAFGVTMYAGSTLITLTLIWGFRIILSKDILRGKGSLPEHQQDQSSTNTNWSLKQCLSTLNDTGVNIDKGTAKIAGIMLLSLIPFAMVELVALVNSPVTSLLALVVSGGSLILYFAYQIGDPWIQVRSLAYLKQEDLRNRFFFHVQRLAEDDLIDENGNPKFDAFKRTFKEADTNEDGYIVHEELEHLIKDILKLKEDNISYDYAKAEILTHFDDDNSGKISWLEFSKGCTKWLEKWKNVKSSSTTSASTNLWKQVKMLAIKNELAGLTQMEIIMPRILRQLLENGGLVKDNIPDKEKIEGIFIEYDKDGDHEMKRHELKKFIETLHFGVSLDRDTVLENLLQDFDNDKSDTISQHEFVEGFIKWMNKATKHDPSIKDLKHAITKFEEDTWKEIDKPKNAVKREASILYVIFGVGIMYLISGAFMQSILQFSNAAHIPFHLTSFVVFPIAMNARMVIMALLNASPHVSKNASLSFSEIYSGLVMNNLLGLLTLLISVHMKRLSWTYSNEVLIIMIPCAIVGLFALKRDTYPLWASVLAMLLYPISIGLYYVMYS